MECDLAFIAAGERCSRDRIPGIGMPSQGGLCIRGATLVLPSQTTPHRSAQSTDSTHSLLPGPGLPVSPIVPPSVLQGPRFMTSEYNSKYLKEPSNQPGGCLSELMPPSHFTPDPWRDPQRVRAGTALGRHRRRNEGRAGRVGEPFSWADLSALGLLTPKGQLPGFAGLREPDHGCLLACRPCPSFWVSLVLYPGFWSPPGTHGPGGSGLQFLRASSLPITGTVRLWRPQGWARGPWAGTRGLSFTDLLQKKSIGAKEDTGFTKESTKNPIAFQPPSQAIPGNPVSQAGSH